MNRGFSTIEAVIALAGAGILLSGVLGALSLVQRSATSVEIKGKSIDYQNYIKSKVSCEKTVLDLNLDQCDGRQFISLKDPNGNTVTTGTEIGDNLIGELYMRSKCQRPNGTVELIVETQTTQTTPTLSGYQPAFKVPYVCPIPEPVAPPPQCEVFNAAAPRTFDMEEYLFIIHDGGVDYIPNHRWGDLDGYLKPDPATMRYTCNLLGYSDGRAVGEMRNRRSPRDNWLVSYDGTRYTRIRADLAGNPVTANQIECVGRVERQLCSNAPDRIFSRHEYVAQINASGKDSFPPASINDARSDGSDGYLAIDETTLDYTCSLLGYTKHVYAWPKAGHHLPVSSVLKYDPSLRRYVSHSASSLGNPVTATHLKCSGRKLATLEPTIIFQNNPLEMMNIQRNCAEKTGKLKIAEFDTGALNFDDVSAQKICNCLGYQKVASKSSQWWSWFRDDRENRQGFRSPSNNVLATWNPILNNWVSNNAAALGNRWVSYLTCGGPLRVAP